MGDCNSLGNHFEPVLLLLAPLYWIFPSVAVLFAVQALALSSAMIPLYCISKRILQDRLLVFSVLAAYFLSRGIQGAGMFEFHTDCFLPLLVFYAYYFLIDGRMRGTVWMCLGMLLCKENSAFLIAGLGIFAFTRKESRRFGGFLIAGAVAFWIAVTKFLVPFFLGDGGTENYQYLAWLPFGPSLQDNWKVFLHNPLGFLARY
jgi:uncharacterized membrane protein